MGLSDGGGASAPLHILSDIDINAKTATCVICGHTKIRLRSDNGKWRCSTSEKITRYGLEPGQYNALFKQQIGRCAICGKRMRSPHIDHDHATGAIRGLLCSNCNTGIGLLGDSTDRLLAAILYLDSEWVDKA